MQVIGLIFILPFIVSIIYSEPYHVYYLLPLVISIVLGKLITVKLKGHKRIRLKHAMIISSLVWIWAGLMSTIAIYLSIDISLVDAFFESMSGWTCTGLTLFDNVETLPHSLLFLRSLEQWLGGLGVVVVVLGISFKAGTAVKKLYQSEAREDRIKPSVANTLHKTIKIYLIYTVAGIILYIIAGMPVFDSVCNSLTSISTGGMAIKNLSIAHYNSDYINIITMILMILGATSFVVHYNIIKTRGKSFIKDIQFKTMLLIIAITTIIIYVFTNIVPMEILFDVISALTSTGASITPAPILDKWPPFVLIITIVLMLIGGSSGSTVGAIKLNRIIIVLKSVWNNIKSIISPEGRVIPMKVSGHTIPPKAVQEATMYICLYLSFIFISWTIFTGYGFDPFKSLFEVVSAQGNVGLTTGIVNAGLDPLLKMLLVLNMWIGRLEIIPILVTIRSFFEIFK
ncbi:TrkH family potassium uptake protein [Methanobrevibacter sp. DSM 116169]|uniref:TrkH family potassium uptake protein n=1 Tax=Methanobrevibacter sp. DSM 116169 TaxID=3242727 RepID=UPI0038FC3B7D